MSTAHKGLDVQHAPDALGRFGRFGGRFVPETVMAALDELEAALATAFTDPSFEAELAARARDYVGRQTPLYLAERLSAEVGGARIWLKREDLAHTVALATPCWPAPVSATMRRLPSRCASSAWPTALLILCAPVCARSSRLSQMRAPPTSALSRSAR